MHGPLNLKHHYTATFRYIHHTSPNYTSLHLSTLHSLTFTLHYPFIWLKPLTFPTALIHLFTIPVQVIFDSYIKELI